MPKRSTPDAVDMSSAAATIGDSSDSQLIELSKTGNSAAFAELWTRHAAAGRTVARSFSSSLDPDDLVAEAYTRIYQLLQKGRGPTGAFRPYLFTTIRNTASSWGRARRETSIDTLETFEDPASGEEAGMAALDRGLTASAFRTLPTRWQEVLWYSEVEAMTPAQIAPLLGMSANGVAALAYRAREGLRQAWIGVHLNSLSEDSECRWTIDHLGVYTRGSLGQRDTSRLEKHLDECAMCTIAASEAKEVGSRLALVLLPLTAGVGGAAAYTYWLQTGGPTGSMALAGPMPVTITASGAGGAGGGSSSSSGSTATASSASKITTATVIGGLAVAASVVAAVVFGPGLFASGRPRPAVDVAEVPSPPAADTSDGATGSEPTTDTAVPPAPVVPMPVAPISPELPVATKPTPVRPAPTTAPTSVPTTSPTPQPTKPPVPPVPPVELAAPVISRVDTAGDRFFPALSGTASPGANVQLIVSSPATASAPARNFAYAVIADSNGAWSSTVNSDAAGNPLTAGTHSVTATQHLSGETSKPGAALSFTIMAPVVGSPIAGSSYPENALPALSFSGAAGATLQFSQDGGATWSSAQLDSAGIASTAFAPGLLPGPAVLTTRYAAADGRVGPLNSTGFTVTPAVPVAPLSPTFTIDTANGLYFPIVSGTDAVPDAAITVWIDGVMVATADADGHGVWATNAIAQLSVGTHQLAATQTANGLTSPASVDQSFTLTSPTIVAPADGALIPLATNVDLAASGVPGARFGTRFFTTHPTGPSVETLRNNLVFSAQGAGGTVFDYNLRAYWNHGTLSVFYTDGTRVGPNTTITLGRTF